MEIFCKELNKTFPTKQEMFTALKGKKEELIGLKKSEIKTSEGINLSIKDNVASKGTTEVLKIGDKIKVAMNTTNYLDHDGDLIIDGAWNKSAQEQNGKTYHIINHDLKIGSIVAYPKNVSVSVERVDWSNLGKSYEGSTDVLVFESTLTEKTNNDAFLAYKDGEDVEHSIRLMYIKIDLAINSDDQEDKAEKALYDKYIAKVANKEVAEERGYMWIVSEAKIYKEGSLVLFGANDATPPLKEMKPLKDTSKKNNEPPPALEIDYVFLTQNIFKK